MEICKELIKLNKEINKLGSKLYIVGGFVRDNILGFENDDIDITSNVEEEKIIKICNKLKATTSIINKKLGTLQIKYNNYKFEYTRFRKESYTIKGSHTPDNVEFVDSLESDCLRRDFTINSIYYDITEDKLVDLKSGISHLKKRIIKTTNSPHITLSDDGLRILRAIRFCSTLAFKFERKTKSALKTFAPLLNLISKERILKELNQLVVADLKYEKKNTVFLNSCNKFSLPKYMFNSSLDRIRKFSKLDIKNFYNLSTNSRLIGFYILIIKNYLNGYTPDHQLGYNVNMLLDTNGIKESTKNIQITEKIYRIYQNLQYKVDDLNASINYLTLSNAEREIVDNYLDSKGKERLNGKIEFIKSHKLPLSIHQLDITAQDLLDLKIERKYISKILMTLLNQVLNMQVANVNEDLKKLASELHETFSKISKEIL